MTDYPGAIWYPAHPSNYYRPQEAPFFHAPNSPKGMVLHTPEEPADAVESTPAFFAQPGRAASTHYYLDNDGDIYQLVDERNAAIANGVVGKPYPRWADPSHSLNWQSLSVEIEGFADTIHTTLIRGQAQWQGLLALIRHRCAAYSIPLTRERIIGHYEVSNQRRDPGLLFPWGALMFDLLDNSEEDMYRIHYVRATKGIWTGRPLHILDKQDLNAYYDFTLPLTATRVRVEFYLQSGYLVVQNGNQTPAGRIGWGVEKGKPSYGLVDVSLTKEGWFSIVAEDKTNPAVILDANSLGFWEA